MASTVMMLLMDILSLPSNLSAVKGRHWCHWWGVFQGCSCLWAWVEYVPCIWDDISLHCFASHLIASHRIWMHCYVLTSRRGEKTLKYLGWCITELNMSCEKYWGWYITGGISTYATKIHAMCVLSTWAILQCIKCRGCTCVKRYIYY